MAAPPLVLVTTDRRDLGGGHWHVTRATYVEAALLGAGALPVMLPSLGGDLDLEGVLDRVDGVLVTGAEANVHPSLYGVEPTASHEPFDPARDATTLPLIRATLARDLPMLAICRGHQELNVALGGTLATEIQTLPGRMDHRAPVLPTEDEQYGIRHPVDLVAGGRLAEICGAASIEVNSLHRQAIDRLAEGLAVEALAADGTIEAVRVAGKRFALSVQWHPEYWARSDAPSAKIFAAFGAALRATR